MGAGGSAGVGRGKLRLLVALEIPDLVRCEIDLWRRRALSDPALRITDELRVNLLFLGRRPQRDAHRYLEAIRERCARAPAPVIELCVHVSAGMSRKEPEDAYIDDELAEELFSLADDAEQYFDRIKIRGLSKTERTATGKKKSIEVNLLSERLQVEDSLEEARGHPSMPAQEAVFAALDSARRELQRGGRLAAAAEARLALDAD